MIEGRILTKLRNSKLVLSPLVATLALACDPQEPPRVEVPVTVDSSLVVPVETDLGYRVELTEVRLVVDDFGFAIGGEIHSSLWKNISDFLVPEAQAHPGHLQAGDVTGELRGQFVVDWLHGDGDELGNATMLAGLYESANFAFGRAETSESDASADLLARHTAHLAGTAEKDGVVTAFTATIDSPDGRQLIGAPCEVRVSEDASVRLGFRLSTIDPYEEDTLFDGVEFAALGPSPVAIVPDATTEVLVDAYNVLRRTVQTHDHYGFSASSSEE